MHIRLILITSLLSLPACGGDDRCDPIANEGCDVGLACELVEGGEPGCFAPVYVRGRVFDLETAAAIEGAVVIALDVNGAPVSQNAITDASGNYELRIPSTRNAEGVPTSIELTLRADAAGYQTFPAGLRQALPVDTAAAVGQDDGSYEVRSALTDIGLLPFAGAGTGSIRGGVEIDALHTGVLVVAEGPATGSSIADRDGNYVIFNLDAGDYEVRGYAQGVNYLPGTVTLPAGESAELDLALSDEAASTINGTVQLVNPEEGAATSIVLVVQSTFDTQLLRGATPPGLRAPAAGIVPDVTGAFTIEGVPAGNYYILAGFENDGLVRDPDTCIGGTDLVSQAVGVGQTITIEDSFKVTGAIALRSPGAAGAEALAASPTFVFADDASAEEYRIVVVDAFGTVVWEHTEVDLGGGDKSVAYTGPTLESGMYYQYRVISTKIDGALAEQCELARSEDLKGVFYMQ